MNFLRFVKMFSTDFFRDKNKIMKIPLLNKEGGRIADNKLIMN